jgi:isoleucyl-tRNA synthetase
MVEKKHNLKNKQEILDLGVEKFIKECKDWAIKHVGLMTDQFRGLGVWMDWNTPYMTLDDEYIEAAWWTVKKASEKNLLLNDLRVVTWCPRCETALAEAELDYQDRSA